MEHLPDACNRQTPPLRRSVHPRSTLTLKFSSCYQKGLSGKAGAGEPGGAGMDMPGEHAEKLWKPCAGEGHRPPFLSSQRQEGLLSQEWGRGPVPGCCWLGEKASSIPSEAGIISQIRTYSIGGGTQGSFQMNHLIK